MTRSFITLFFALAMLFLNAQETIIWEEQFDGGIPESWTIGPGNPVGAIWQWSASGRADSAMLLEPTAALLFNNKGPIDSPSRENGAAMYNSDVYDTGGIGFGGGPFPGQHSGSLTSPMVDLSDHEAVFLKFNQYAHANGAAVSTLLALSADGGNTWNDISINSNIILNAETAPDDVQLIDVSDLAGGQDSVQVRFSWDGRFYFWLIDDVQFIETPANNLALGSNIHYPLSSYAQPESQIITDTLEFYADISNFGSQDQTNVVLKAWISNLAGDILFQDSTFVDELSAGTTDFTVIIDNVFIPQDLMLDEIYTVHYFVYSLDDPDSDISMDDNSYAADFTVTETTFAKEDGNGLEGVGQDADWMIGNVYEMSPNELIDGQFQAASAVFSASRNNLLGPLAGEQVSLMLFKVNPDVLPDWSNFDLTSIGQDDDLELISRDTFLFPEGYQNFELAEVSLNNLNGSGQPVLDPGARYILAVSYEGSANNILHSSDKDIAYDQISSIVYVDQWSLEGFGPKNAALLRLNLDLVLQTDDEELPDGTLQLFPNPVRDKLNIQINASPREEALLITADTSGRVLNYQVLENIDPSNEHHLNVSGYAEGQYIVRLVTKNGSLTKSFVVVR
jgi:hypothetical protein